MIRLLLGAVLCLVGATALRAQIIPRPPGASRGLQPVRRDSTDTTSLVKWPIPDSITQALLARPGYTVTRYQGDTAFLNVDRKSLDLLAAKKRPAVVTRDSQTIVSDSGIYYSDANRMITTGGHYVIRDPSSGQADITGSERADYNLAERAASVRNARFAVNNGDMWYLSSRIAKVVADSTNAKESKLYARGGSITSCEDTIPDYHFEFKEAKRAGANTIVARPAILYIKDIPVMWLPFIFSDERAGRHSGILAPQFGVSDIVRNSPTYRRNIEHVGYYWALNDYMDFGTWLDWRSGSGGTPTDPGWLRTNADWQYKWIDRFLAGRVGVGYTKQGDGSTNLAVSWGHQQEFSANSRFNTSLNYVTSTTLQRQNTFNPYTALATISSQATYQTKIGPASMSLGGTRTQYPGREQTDQTFPTLSLSTTPLGLGDWFVWTPSFSLSRKDTRNIDQAGIGAFAYTRNPTTGALDSSRTLGRSSANASMTFDTPIRLFGQDIRNSFRVTQERNNFPQQQTIVNLQTGAIDETRIFAATYRTDIDWTPDFALPPLARNKFNITPSVSLQNVDPGPFWVSSMLTNGRYVHQSKRPTFGLSASPTLFGRFPGFGPFSALRHSIAPTIGYTYAPAQSVSDEYLRAINRSRAGYLGGLRQNQVNFGLNQNIEAKVRSKADTLPSSTGQTIRLLTINMTPISYDFERASKARYNASVAGRSATPWAGFTTDTWGYNLSSDLLPGFEFSSQYSLFLGDPISDTASFSPYLTSVSAGFSFGRDQNPLAVLTRLFGKAVPEAQKSPDPATTTVRTPIDQPQAQMIAAQPVAGDMRGPNRFVTPPSSGWRASFNFSRSSPRPPKGDNVIQFDPRLRCQQVTGNDPFLLEACLAQQRAQPTNELPVLSTIPGGPAYNIPATTSLNGNIAFNLTEKWATTWQTTYDFELHQFASHIVSLQRELHDWRAIFGFTQSPNGNFAFHFTIGLKAEPDLKFDYNRATVRSGFTPF